MHFAAIIKMPPKWAFPQKDLTYTLKGFKNCLQIASSP